MLPLYDAHNHLQDAWLAPQRAQILTDLAAAGGRHAVVNGTGETDWPEVQALSQTSPIVLPSYGLHPWDVGNRSPDWQENLLTALKPAPAKVGRSAVALAKVGEIGLDRWILDRAHPDDPRLAGLRRAPLAEQTEVFLWQLDLAATANLPMSIHCLDAWDPLLDLLRGAKRPARGFLLHAYSGPVEMVQSFADLGAHFSFNGNFLEPRKTRLRELYTTLPADRLLVETDAPAMCLPPAIEKFPPISTNDGSLANHPANLVAAYRALADLRRTDLETLAAQVGENFRGLFLEH
ncbi:MAG: TatD family deoxyribonuclease [Opitutus sp.]|nr:TatD family deoxyribonuclease [Opitutus sp.]